MTDQTRKAERFRGLHAPGRPLILFNIWDAGGAKAVASGGAKAIATSSWSVANVNGFRRWRTAPAPLGDRQPSHCLPRLFKPGFATGMPRVTTSIFQ